MIKTEGLILPEIVDANFQNRFIPEMSEETYLKDFSAVSSSHLKEILDSPQHYLAYLYEKQVKGKDESKNTAIQFGKAAHMALHEFERFKNSVIVMPDFGDQRNKANKEFKKNWFIEHDKPGAVFVTIEEHEELQFGIDSMLDHPIAREVLTQKGQFETCGNVRHPATGLKSKFKPDFLTFDKANILVDFKTARDNSWRGFQSAIADRRYDIQMGKYSKEIELITGKKIDIVIFITLENDKPRTCAVYEFDLQSLNYGIECYEAGMHKLKKCLAENSWPSRQNQVEIINSPEWLLKKDIKL